MNENTTPTKLECLVDTSLLNNPLRLRERAAAIEAHEAGQPVDKWDDVDQKWIELVEISAFFYDRRYRARPAAEQYLLISLPRSQSEVWFWGPDEKGYTRDASRAGRYTQETAHQIIQGTSGEVIAMLESDLSKLGINHVIDLGWGDNGRLIKTLYTLALPASALA